MRRKRVRKKDTVYLLLLGTRVQLFPDRTASGTHGTGTGSGLISTPSIPAHGRLAPCLAVDIKSD